jgi:hypothetical protein
MKNNHGFGQQKTNPIQTQFWRLLVFIRVNSWLILQNKANRRPLAGCRRPDGDGRRGGWMMDGSTLFNRLSSFLASVRRRAGNEKLFETSV